MKGPVALTKAVSTMKVFFQELSSRDRSIAGETSRRTILLDKSIRRKSTVGKRFTQHIEHSAWPDVDKRIAPCFAH